MTVVTGIVLLSLGALLLGVMAGAAFEHYTKFFRHWW
jgi:hypothetical protein